MMQHKEGFFSGVDGAELYYQAWQPDGPIRAALLIAHGLGEHSGRYQNVVKALVPQGYAIYALDHRGYGRSSGRRGHINSWAEYREDLHRFAQMARAAAAERPLFLMGHSMGGCIVLDYAGHYPDGWQGVIASAPAVGKLNIPAPLALVSKLLSSVWPTLSVSSGLDVTAISRDTAVVEAYQNDPLVHDKGTPRLATEFARVAGETLARAGQFRPPLLLLHGDADRLVNVQNTRDFYAAVPHENKKLIIYPGGYHESHNDLHKEKMLADLAAWLEERLNQASETI